MSSPGRKCEFDIMYGEGISYEGDLLDLAVEAEMMKKLDREEKMLNSI